MDAVKDVGAEAFSSGLMDQVSSAKARGRRASRLVWYFYDFKTH